MNKIKCKSFNNFFMLNQQLIELRYLERFSLKYLNTYLEFNNSCFIFVQFYNPYFLTFWHIILNFITFCMFFS